MALRQPKTFNDVNLDTEVSCLVLIGDQNHTVAGKLGDLLQEVLEHRYRNSHHQYRKGRAWNLQMKNEPIAEVTRD